MTSAGASSKTFLYGIITIRFGWTMLLECISRWRVLVGSVLGALLLNAPAQANLLQGLDNVPAPATESVPMPYSPATHSPTPYLPVENEVHFYGQVPRPIQIGADYLVIETYKTGVVGAIFREYSSFDCFQGHVQGEELALQITNSYTRESYSYAIALSGNDGLFATTAFTGNPLQLEGFVDLGTASSRELSMLDVCRADLM